MGILNKLWNKLWSAEEAKKSQVYQEKVSAVVVEAERERAKLTYLQQLAMRHGGPDRSDDYSQFQANIQYHGARQAQVQQKYQAGTYMPPNQMSIISTNPLSWPQVAGPGAPIPSSIWGSGGLSGPVYSHTAIFSDYNQETFFKALRGIEEAACMKPEGNHDYDDLSYPLQDMRKFKAGEISLLALMSFCLCNVMEVEPVVALLEGYGMTVVD